MNTLFIINPVAGKKQILQKIDIITDLFKNANFNLNIHYTKFKSDAEKITRKYGEDCDLIVCAGGDGTLSEVINGFEFLKNKPKLGYIPSGTTNDFATSLGLPKNLTDAAKVIINGNSTFLDTIKFGSKNVMYVASFGAFTKTSYNTPQNLKNFWGHSAYIFESIKELGNIKEYDIKLSINDTVFEDKYIFGAVTNSTSVGGLVKFNPKTVMFNDGFFDVILIKKPNNLVDLIKLIYSLNTFDYNNDFIFFTQTDNIKIECSKPLDWSLDGENYKSDKIIDVKMLNKYINFIVPKK